MALHPSYARCAPISTPSSSPRWEGNFAAVGGERNGIPLSMISALTQLGLDPWDEARRLASVFNREAVERLPALIRQLPGAARPA